MSSSFKVFGLEFGKQKKTSELSRPLQTVVQPTDTQGAIVNARRGLSGSASEFLVYGQNFEAAFQTNIDKINFYRVMAENPFVHAAIEDVVNDAITYDDAKGIVSVTLDSTDFSGSIKQKIIEEFNTVLKLLKFDIRGHDIFRQWYVDGQLYCHLIVEPETMSEGISAIRFADPRHIKKIIDITKDNDGLEMSRDEYFLYLPENINSFDAWNKQGRDFQSTNAIKLTNDSVVYIWSGIVDLNSMPLSPLDKAIKSYNQLTCLEDAIIVYRLSRAPEKLAFYVDVDNMPKTAAEQFMRSLIEKYKNKTVYDVQTGKVDNASQIQSMFHNYWMPRRNGKGTEITTVGGINGDFAKPEELDYFLKKLYRALQIPDTRLSSETTTPFSHGSEITRDELKFSKLISRFRLRFSELFAELLRRQLLLKNIITEEDWEENAYSIRFEFAQDSMFQEMKMADLMAMRMSTLSTVKEYVGPGGFFSREWVWKEVLNMSEDQVARMKVQIDIEEKRGEYDDKPGQQFNGGDLDGFGGEGGDDGGSESPFENPNKEFQQQSKESAKSQTVSSKPNLGSDDETNESDDDDLLSPVMTRMSPSMIAESRRISKLVRGRIQKGTKK